MNSATRTATKGAQEDQISCGDSLNAYEILNLSDLTWDVRLYSVRPANGKKAIHGERGSAKNAFWGLRKQNPGTCSGYGFVIDVNPTTLAVPSQWRVPAADIEIDGFNFSFRETITVSPLGSAFHRSVVEGIVRESIKNHFKNQASDELGHLWQEYNSFCQAPVFKPGDEFAFCRRFSPTAKFLRDGRLVVEMNVNTISVDARSLAEYYESGDVSTLADRIEAKRANRVTRKNQPTTIHVLHAQSNDFGTGYAPLELTSVDAILGHATLSRHEQQELSTGAVQCRKFPRDPSPIRMEELRLVLDTQITRDSHDETIIDPPEREKLYRDLRHFMDALEVFGHRLELANSCISCDDFMGGIVGPPTIRVRHKQKGEAVIPAPHGSCPESLGKRTRLRAKTIRENGFLQSRPLNPVLASPKQFGANRAKRMATDLKYILKNQGIDIHLDFCLYRDAHDLSRQIDKKGYDTAIVVLPERSRRGGFAQNDTHNAIKRELLIPTQCIHHNNTLPENWVERPHREFKSAEPKLARRIRQRYELCLSNLLVKHHWIPFAPAEPFNYNVHVGIDVGGRSNNTAMLCLGHGFSDPKGNIVFAPEEIPIEVQKAEPIPTDSLFYGLKRSFQMLRSELNDARLPFDFNRALFIRDGHFLGNDDIWNELDAMDRLYKDFLERDWIDESAVWTAVEVLKSAEGWRLTRDTAEGPCNPVVGRYVFPFDDENTGLICTTGQPYLHQGTACPLRIRIREIAGSFERTQVVRDIVWEADMCFTKLDIGMRLPWVLNVADTGALQTSRKYRITGIPA